MKKALITFSLFALLLTTLSGCGATPPPVDPVEDEAVLPVVQAGTFAQWHEDEISYTPSIDPYEVNLVMDNPNQGNVTVYENLNLSAAEEEGLNNFGFVVGKGWKEEFFQVYEDNRYDLKANFITTDSLLHTYHLFFNYLLESLEKEELYAAALELSKEMVAATLAQYEELKGTDYEDAALRNVAYFAVAEKLFDPNAETPEMVVDMVKDEVKLIEAHEGIAHSNVLGTEEDLYKEDYSQYIPRGHYTKADKLKRYFKGLMWYGRLTFRLKNVDETKSSILITSLIEQDDSIAAKWDTLYEPINFFVGEPDDLSFYEYHSVAKEVYGDVLSLEAITEDEDKLAEFIKLAKELPDPKINSMPVFAPDFVENDRNEEVKGFRFLGQRSTVDAIIFQKLVYRDVEENPAGEKRMLPMALDIPATMGSDYAYEILDGLGQTDYAKYVENMAKGKEFLAAMDQDNWTKNLYWGWMNTLRTLLVDYGNGYPSFMASKQWKLKELVTFLGSWTELKHDTILYAKQVYAELGGGPMMPEEIDDRGYVEPNPELYNRMKSLINLTIDGLEARELLSQKNKDLLLLLEELSTRLRDISIKELEETGLGEADYEFIRTYGGSLEHFWQETLSEEEKEMSMTEILNSHPGAIVADVATDPNGFVLEEGTGSINTIFVVFPIDGELHVASGGVFSHYEFAWPMDDRLTDEKWRTILFPEWNGPPKGEEKFRPEIADWQKEFTVGW